MIFERLANFDPLAWEASQFRFDKFPYFQFDDAAQAVFIGWSTDLHRRLEAEPNGLIRQHFDKYDKLFPALALIFHLIDRALGGSEPMVSEACALRAAAWCRFLEPHARRCYGLLADGGLRAAQALARKFKEAELPQNFDPQDFSARDIKQKGWRYLADEEAVEAALDWLENKGWLLKRTVSKRSPCGGRPDRARHPQPAHPRRHKKESSGR